MAKAKKKARKTSSKKSAGSRKKASKPVRKSASALKKTVRKTGGRNLTAILREPPTSQEELSALMREPEINAGRSFPRITLKNRLRKMILPLLILILLFLGYSYYHTLKSSLPAYSGDIQLKGLKSSARIARDAYGIPHIEAGNEEDLFFSIGYAQAGDRAWQMNLMKMLANGRLAEFMGEKVLPVDVYMRTIGISRYAENMWKNTGKDLKVLLTAFAAGVNASFAENKYPAPEFKLLGVKPEAWKPQDTFSVYGFINLNLAGNLVEEATILSLLKKIKPELMPLLFPADVDETIPAEETAKLSQFDSKNAFIPAEIFRNELLQDFAGGLGLPASNNWVVGKSRTKNGKSILANDTHLQISLPDTWMIMNVSSPKYRAAGVALAGVPLVILGTNNQIAWGATMVMADNQDLFLEKIRVRDGRREYLYRDQWIPVTRREETFLTKGGGKKIEILEETQHGPLLNKALSGRSRLPFQPEQVDSGYGIALKWSMSDGDDGADGLYRLGRSRTIEEARAALASISSIYLNMVIADADNIAWQVTGKIPLRKKGTGKYPSPGWSGEYDWVGYAPFSSNPFVMNPPEGFINTANQKIASTGTLPHISSSYYPRDRFERAKELLSSMSDATGEKMSTMQMDHVSPFARKIAARLSGEFGESVKKAIARLNKEDRRNALEAFDIIRNFDGSMNLAGMKPAVFSAFLHTATLNIFRDEIGAEDTAEWNAFQMVNKRMYNAPYDHILKNTDSRFWDNVSTTEKETAADIFAISLAQAIDLCEDRMGDNRRNWQWGKIHTYEFKHDIGKRSKFLGWFLNKGPFSANGSLHTINMTGFLWGKDFDTFLIPAMRLVVDFSREEPASLIIPGGQSGHFLSDHYDSMIPLFLQGKQHPLPMQRHSVEKQYTSVLNLSPEK